MRRFLKVLSLTLPAPAFAGGVLNIMLGAAAATLLASSSPSSINYSAAGSSLTTSGSATCSATGGIAPYSFSWSFASGGSGITINSPSSASTTFTVSSPTVNTTYTGTAQCTATDSQPVTSGPSSGVSLSISRIPLLPPSFGGTSTLTVGKSVVGGNTYLGYWAPNSFGSLSPSVDFNGYTTEGVYWLQGTVTSRALFLEIAQPSSNSTYVTQMTVNGTVFPTSSATYSYSSPYGTWEWGSVPNPFSGGVGTTDPVWFY